MTPICTSVQIATEEMYKESEQQENIKIIFMRKWGPVFFTSHEGTKKTTETMAGGCALPVE